MKINMARLLAFTLAVALLTVPFGWPVGVSFAGGWMVNNWLWVRAIKDQLPAIIKREVTQMIVKALTQARKN